MRVKSRRRRVAPIWPSGPKRFLDTVQTPNSRLSTIISDHVSHRHRIRIRLGRCRRRGREGKKARYPFNPPKRADIFARLSVYLAPHSFLSYTAFVPHFLWPQFTIPHTAIAPVLNRTSPWSFLEELHTCVAWIEYWGPRRRQA